MSSKIVKVTIVIVVAIVVVLLVYQATPSGYLSVSDVVNNYNTYRVSQVQVMGNVSAITLAFGGKLAFTLTDGKASINVIYTGVSVQNFQKGITIVVIGKLISDNLLQANQILTKCPSKYG